VPLAGDGEGGIYWSPSLPRGRPSSPRTSHGRKAYDNGDAADHSPAADLEWERREEETFPFPLFMEVEGESEYVEMARARRNSA